MYFSDVRIEKFLHHMSQGRIYLSFYVHVQQFVRPYNFLHQKFYTLRFQLLRQYKYINNISILIAILIYNEMFLPEHCLYY